MTAPTKAAPAPSTAVAVPAGAPLARAQAVGVIPFDPFAYMDRLDADAFVKEMSGVVANELVYKIKDGAKETWGLSKAGIDECCMMLIAQHQVIREEDITFEFIGDGDNREAIFKCTAARYAVSDDGREVRFDQVIGVKREPLFEERAPLTMDSRVPGRKWRHLSFRQALDEPSGDARGFLEWIRDRSDFDDETKAFVTAVLAGHDVREFAVGKRFNPFWYEHGAMKAARNARFRLIPASIKTEIIALAKQEAGKVLEVDRAEVERAPAPGAAIGAGAQQQTRDRLAHHEAKNRPAHEQAERELAPAAQWIRRDPDAPAYVFPFGEQRGTPLDAAWPVGHANTGYIVSVKLLERARDWADGILNHAKPFKRPGNGAKEGPIEPDERPKFENMVQAMTRELEARADAEADSNTDDRADPTPAAGSTEPTVAAPSGSASSAEPTTPTSAKPTATTTSASSDGTAKTDTPPATTPPASDDDRGFDEEDSEDLPF